MEVGAVGFVEMEQYLEVNQILEVHDLVALLEVNRILEAHDLVALLLEHRLYWLDAVDGESSLGGVGLTSCPLMHLLE